MKSTCSHLMRTLLRKNRYSVGINEDFDGVIRGCSKNLTDGIGKMAHGWARISSRHSPPSISRDLRRVLEVWDNETDELVGGVYWCHHRQGLYWRKHVLQGSVRSKDRPHLPG